MPICLCSKRPLISLGEHHNTPKQSANPISKLLVKIPKSMGVVVAKPTKTAFEKLVLLKNSCNSLACLDTKFMIGFSYFIVKYKDTISIIQLT